MRWYFVAESVTYSNSVTNYCPQVTPDYAITFTIVYGNSVTNYCPQTTPDYSFAQSP
jgi:hypothetical protein